MLNIRAPSQVIGSWRDFFIHIATIVVSLLIAVGLEQGAEALHGWNELRETRRALAVERVNNQARLAEDETNWFAGYANLINDLLVLDYIKQHPGVKQTELPGDLRWVQQPFHWEHAVWDTALGRGVVRRMSIAEANERQKFYSLMSDMNGQSFEDWNAFNDAAAFNVQYDDATRLSAAELAEVTRRAQYALAKHFQLGYSFGRYAREFPDAPHRITYELLGQLRQSAFIRDPVGMAAAHKMSDERIDAIIKKYGE